MEITRYQKHFGVGPLAFLTSLFLLGLLLLLDRRLGHPSILNQPKTTRIMGLVLIGCWICWHSWAIKTIRSWWNQDRLCTSGPFRFVRHPIYAGFMWLADLGIALLFNSWIVLVWPVILYPIWSMLVRKEEKMMTAFFGHEYIRYASRKGRFFPRLF
jgi:protein-S-isoprenylcysteine O-methyltransferase Ste14